jgi:hypothetical protein
MFVVDVPKRVTGMTKVDGSNAMPFSLLEDFIRHATTILEIAHDWRLSTHSNCRLKALLQACWRKVRPTQTRCRRLSLTLWQEV